jgi:anti-sigma factor RsiW
MNHPGDGLLQAYIDGEVTGDEKSSLVAHVSACADCGRELEELQAAAATFSSAMSLFGGTSEAAIPAVDAARQRVRSAARSSHTGSHEPIVISLEEHRASGRAARFAAGGLARAAALVLLLAGGAAAMIPGSPVRRWLAMGWDLIAGSPTETSVPVAVTTPAPAPARPMVPGAEMSIAPSNGSVRVQVWASAGAGRLKVRLVDSDRATFQADSSAHQVAFRSARGSIEILNLGTADAEIQLPRSLRSAVVEINGKQYLVKEAGQLRTTGPVVSRTDDEVVFRTGS